MEDKVLELIGMVQKGSPELWRIALQQVAVQKIWLSIGLWIGVLFLIGTIVGLAATVVTYRRSRGLDKSEQGMGIGLILIMLGAVLVPLGAVAQSYLTATMNPEYKAIQILMELVK